MQLVSLTAELFALGHTLVYILMCVGVLVSYIDRFSFPLAFFLTDHMELKVFRKEYVCSLYTSVIQLHNFNVP